MTMAVAKLSMRHSSRRLTTVYLFTPLRLVVSMRAVKSRKNSPVPEVLLYTMASEGLLYTPVAEVLPYTMASEVLLYTPVSEVLLYTMASEVLLYTPVSAVLQHMMASEALL